MDNYVIPGDSVLKFELCIVTSCRDLAIRGERKSSDPIATVYYKKEEFSTQVIQKTRFPRWKKSFDLNVPRSFSDPDSKSLIIVVYDFDRLAHNKFMGQASTCIHVHMYIHMYKLV